MLVKIVLFLAFVAFCQGAPNDVSWRIVGGSEAAPGAAPYQVVLKIVPDTFNCAGSIVSKRSVLTAAHCVFWYKPEELLVVAGSNQLSSGGVTYRVASHVVHENYSSWYMYNDLALMTLTEDLEFSSRIKPIELGNEYIDGGSSVTLTGWGMTTFPGPAAENLQTIDLRTISFDECKERWTGGNIVYSTQMCTFTKAGEGACKGDSGGPLIANNKLVGIVSWGKPCAAGKPDVYTRISSFVEWINTHIVN